MLPLDDIPNNIRETIEELKTQNNIVGLSGGKDSMATCIILHKLGIPFKTITAEVWWKEGITGEQPRHYDFIHNVAVPKLRKWGVKCDFTRSKITAYEYMTTPIKASKAHPEREGKLRGFPLCGRCGIQRDCKTRPCERYYKEQDGPYNVITGIASDEPERMESNTTNGRISILGLLQVKEWECFSICKAEGMLSPTYTFSDRGGCWFCPNQKIQELEVLYREQPQLWEELMQIQRMPNKVQENFTRTKTLYDIEEQIKSGVQMRMFFG